VWVVLCLLLAGAAQLVLLTSVRLPVLLVCAALLGLAAQGAKIAVDTIVQRDTPDEFRGRAFALYDVVYNSAFIAAAAIAAATLPDSGYSRPVFAVLAVGYLTTAAVFGARGLRSPRPTSPAGA
jgi:MFS family permease